jgi:hypothetical protein
MPRKRQILSDQQGLSPIFSAIYLIFIALLLFPLLFFAISVSSAGLTEQMHMEQERMQERVALIGPGAVNITDNTYYDYLRVNNTGSITVRLRALYIGRVFLCDPSLFPGDAYIAPQESLWIPLYDNNIVIEVDDASQEIWRITTERGTTAYELGSHLQHGNGEFPYDPNKFYYGPLMILFDQFFWRNDDLWMDGWMIPKGTRDVMWRITIANIDERTILLTEASALTLISNDNSPKDPVPWYIDPELSSFTLKPGVLNYMYYAWSKPASEGGASLQDINMPESSTCITFLTFYGFFVEPDGTLTPFGETIPFEAVLIEPT